MIVTTLLLAQAAIASPASVTWDSITLGAPASSIRARFGDPLRVVVFDKPPQHVARYSFPGSDSTYVLVMEERGYVKVNAPMLHASVDEDGAPQLAGQVSATTRVRYGFKNGRVPAILWSTSVLHDGADGPPLADPAGDSISTAILNMQTNEIDGVAWEYRYLAFHPCGNDGRWRLKQQALMNKEGRAYDLLHVVCPPTKVERNFFFDVTNFFGKL
jgi:hypothetical protein